MFLTENDRKEVKTVGKYKSGTYIEVVFEFGPPEYIMVHGHLSKAKFWASVENAYGGGLKEDYDDPAIVHTYCRCVPDNTHLYEFRYIVPTAKNSGAFPVTIAWI